MPNLWNKVVPTKKYKKKDKSFKPFKELPDAKILNKRQMVTELNKACKTSGSKTHFRSFAVKQSKYSSGEN